jgi:hypothetical protein
MCDAPGSTKEHAPPYSFFPRGYRDNLWTVPSCDEHNSKNNLDVEYVRNIIATHLITEDSAGAHLQDTVLRSFENSPKLFNRTFADARPVTINDNETAAYTFDLPRFTNVMTAIANAMYFRLRGKRYADSWGIFSPALISKATLYKGLPDSWESYRKLLRQIQYSMIPTPQPEIFQLGIHQFNEEQFIYAFLFYRGFVVNLLGLAPTVAA